MVGTDTLLPDEQNASKTDNVVELGNIFCKIKCWLLKKSNPPTVGGDHTRRRSYTIGELLQYIYLTLNLYGFL